MLARLAENLFWAGRYLERAEDTARLLDVTYHGLLESPGADTTAAWRSLLDTLGQLAEFDRLGQRCTDEAVSEFLVTDVTNPGSIASAVRTARENVRSLREQVSAELWEALNSFYLALRARDLAHDIESERFDLYSMVKQRCQTITGVADQSMPRDDGWRLFDTGRQLERAIMTGRLIDVYFRDLPDEAMTEFHLWRNLLRAASAFEAFTRAAGAEPKPRQAIDYLLVDDHFPRSVLFCLRTAEANLQQLDSADATKPSLRVLGRIRARLEYSDPTERHSHHADFVRELIAGVQQAIDSITWEYFLPARPAAVHAYEAH